MTIFAICNQTFGRDQLPILSYNQKLSTNLKVAIIEPHSLYCEKRGSHYAILASHTQAPRHLPNILQLTHQHHSL